VAFEEVTAMVEGIGLRAGLADFFELLEEARSLLGVFLYGDRNSETRPDFRADGEIDGQLDPNSGFGDWLTHLAGAGPESQNDPIGSFDVKNYLWGPDSRQSKLIAESAIEGVLHDEIVEILREHRSELAAIKSRVGEFEYLELGEKVVLSEPLSNSFQSRFEPSGHPRHEACFQAWDLNCQLDEIGQSKYRVLRFSGESICTRLFDGGVAAACTEKVVQRADPRIFYMVGRGRLDFLEIRLGLLRAITGGTAYTGIQTEVVLSVDVDAQVSDLYDFSYAAGPPAPDAATIQLAQRGSVPPQVFVAGYTVKSELAWQFQTVDAWIDERRVCVEQGE
jgi:hypothetical protein